MRMRSLCHFSLPTRSTSSTEQLFILHPRIKYELRVSVHILNARAIPPLDRKLFAPFPFCFLLACFFLCIGGAEARKLVADSSLKSYMRPEAMDVKRRLLAQLYSNTVNISPNQKFAVGPITGYSCIKFSVSAYDEDHEKVGKIRL